MHRIDGPGSVSGTWVEADPNGPQEPTEFTADFMNAVQEEIAGFIEGEGIALNKASNNQLGQAIRSSSGGGRRNLLINGGFDLWQRTGPTGQLVDSSGTFYIPDRWAVVRAGAMGEDLFLRRVAFDEDQADVAGNPEYYLQLEKTQGAIPGTTIDLVQRIEGVGTLHGQEASFSVDAREVDNAPVHNLEVRVRQHFGSGGSADVETLLGTLLIDGPWTRYSVSGTIPSIAGKTIGTDHYLELQLRSVPIGGTWDLHLTQAQLELGATPSKFERVPLADELRLAQRYYEKTYPVDSAVNSVTDEGEVSCLHDTSTGAEVFNFELLRFATMKRAVPTVVWYDPVDATPVAGEIFYSSGGSGQAVTSEEGDRMRPGRPRFNATPSTGLGRARAHWSAEAEL